MCVCLDTNSNFEGIFESILDTSGVTFNNPFSGCFVNGPASATDQPAACGLANVLAGDCRLSRGRDCQAQYHLP